MEKVLRHYLYADVEMINSFFNQIYSDIKSFVVTKSGGYHTNLSAEVKFPAILQGFLKGNFSGEYGRDRGHDTSIKVDIPLEEKIKLICSKAVGNETTSIVLPKQTEKTLVLGKALIFSESAFGKLFSECLSQTGFNSLDDFYGACLQNNMSVSTWEKIAVTGKKYCCTGNQIGIMKLMQYFDYPKEGKVEGFLILDSFYPIRMFLSTNKLLASESTVRAAKYWRSISNTNVLGVLYKLSSNIYSLKPLALWTIVDYSTFSESTKYEIEHFMEMF